ncbi:collagen-binding domain-containing protein [Enterococcus villorum]|uniref:collagen-binding domain-containing protein n=1 Tax=Enterococcus villorum TaxID=112904 RepID=UPI0030B864A9
MASQFHVFSKGKTTVNAHTDGNIATKELDAKNNFGTDVISGDLQLEINYVQMTDSLIGSSFVSGDNNRINKFVVGSSISTGIENDRAVVNGSRVDHLSASELYQDRPGNVYIDFEAEFAKLEAASGTLMALNPAKTYTSDDFPDMNNRTIDVTGMGESNFVSINVDASVLAMNTPLNILNPENKVLVINVVNAPADFTIQSQIHYNDRTNHETEDFSDANISWNFENSLTNLAVNAPFQGTIIAPNSDVTANQNMDGTIIGKNVTLNAATNRWDPNEIFPIDDPDHSDTSTSESSTDTTTSESSTDTSTSESSTDTSTSESSTDTSTSESSTDTTTSESSTDTSTSESSTDTTTSESSTDTDTSDRNNTDTTTSESSTDTTSTSESSTDTSTSESSTDTSTSESSTDTTTSESSTDTSTSESSTDTSTSESSTDTSTSESSTDTKNTSESSNDTTPSESSTDTDTSESNTDGAPASHSGNGSEPDISVDYDGSMNSTPRDIISGNINGVGTNSSVTNTSIDGNQNNDPNQMNRPNKNTKVLPQTNSVSNRWLAMVGASIIVLVFLVAFIKKTKKNK